MGSGASTVREREIQKDADEGNSSELPLRRQNERVLERVRPLRLKGMWAEPPVIEGTSRNTSCANGSVDEWTSEASSC